MRVTVKEQDGLPGWVPAPGLLPALPRRGCGRGCPRLPGAAGHPSVLTGGAAGCDGGPHPAPHPGRGCWSQLAVPGQGGSACGISARSWDVPPGLCPQPRAPSLPHGHPPAQGEQRGPSPALRGGAQVLYGRADTAVLSPESFWVTSPDQSQTQRLPARTGCPTPLPVPAWLHSGAIVMPAGGCSRSPHPGSWGTRGSPAPALACRGTLGDSAPCENW